MRSITLAACTLLLGVTFVFAQQAAEDRIVVNQILGQVEVRSAASGAWRPARIGMPVKAGWDIRTYVESSADLLFASGTVLKISENSVVTVSKAVVTGGTSSTGIKVGTGQILANVKKLTNAKSSFEFETPTAVASIRGTRLGIKVGGDGTEVDVYEGLVMVRHRGSNQETPVGSRQRAVVTRSGAPIRVEVITERQMQQGNDPFRGVDTTKTDTTKIDSSKTGTTPVDSTTSGTAGSDTGSGQGSGADSVAPLKLQIVSPASDAVLREAKATVKGIATPKSTVLVMGREVALGSDGSFSLVVDLVPGLNTIPVNALLGSQTKNVDLSVEYRPDSRAARLTLVVSSPANGDTVNKPEIPVIGTTVSGASVTVNGVPVSVPPSGAFVTKVQIPDEPDEYTIEVIATLGDNEMTVSRVVAYKPKREPLSLVINTPTDRQKINTTVIRITGKTAPGANVSVNGKDAKATPQGLIDREIVFNPGPNEVEKLIGEYPLEIVASDETGELTRNFTLEIDGTSPQINTSMPVLTMNSVGGRATRTPKLQVQVIDQTTEDQITVNINVNGSIEEYQVDPSSKQDVNLDEGKNLYKVKAFDRARNPSNIVSGEIYYLPGPLAINLNSPESNVIDIDDLPPLPRGVTSPKIAIEVEIDDGINNVPESIKYCRISGNGQTKLLKQDGNSYRYSCEVELLPRSANSFVIQAEDLAGTIATKTVSITLR